MRLMRMDAEHKVLHVKFFSWGWQLFLNYVTVRRCNFLRAHKHNVDNIQINMCETMAELY